MMKVQMGIMALLVLAIACTTPVSETVISEDTQIVRAWVEGPDYVFSPSTVSANEPVRIEFDPSRLPGCSRVFTIPSLEVYEFIDAENKQVDFTPTETGRLDVACSMNMYTGHLMVE